jgi:hypothetical protein
LDHKLSGEQGGRVFKTVAILTGYVDAVFTGLPPVLLTGLAVIRKRFLV